MAEHILKTDPEAFEAVFTGIKTYEIRNNDRDYRVGDTLVLRETKYPGAEMRHGKPLVYTGRFFTATISHVLRGSIYGLLDGWAILSFDIRAENARLLAEMQSREIAEVVTREQIAVQLADMLGQINRLRAVVEAAEKLIGPCLHRPLPADECLCEMKRLCKEIHAARKEAGE